MLSKNRLDRVERELERRFEALGPQGEALRQEIDGAEELLRYLYSAMPLSDMVQYPVELFREVAAHGALLREGAFCRDMPEDIFLNYVLHHRVNNEELRPCRRFFHFLLSQRVGGMSLERAALEVNYWCAEEATYQTTDGRTASALAVWSSAQGRCGEESTFAVNALRSVGVPARQVYVPRWSHCDDNHAWVEVWTGEQGWKFLGACEPEEALNRGWFVAASSRAMLVHSRLFDTVAEEEVTGGAGMALELNQLGRYAHTKTLRVKVTDGNGEPVSGAKVYFEVLNYGELYPISVRETDETGEVALTTGRGGLHLRAVKEGAWAEAIAAPEDTDCSLVLGASASPDWHSFDLLPPKESMGRETPLAPEQKEQGKQRLAEANRIRGEKTAGFSTASDSESWRENVKGNEKEIERFLTEAEQRGLGELALRMMTTLSKKDVMDARSEVLLTHLVHAAAYPSEDGRLFDKYILNPRIGLEHLTAWREELGELLTAEQKEKFRQNPAAIWEYIGEAVTELPELEYPGILTTPGACLRSGAGSGDSRKLLFVAVCRTLGIPARLNEQDGAPEYWQGGAFHTVLREAERTALLELTGGEGLVYSQDWTLGRLEGTEGNYRTISLDEPEWLDGRLRLSLPAGEYRLVTASRRVDGGVLGNLLSFGLDDSEEKAVEINRRPLKPADMLTSNPLEPFRLEEGGQDILSTQLGGPAVLVWLEPGEEPTEHILNEALEAPGLFSSLQERFVLILPDEGEKDDPTLNKVLQTFPAARILVDRGREAGQILARRMFLDPGTLPFALVMDSRHNGVYGVCGYNVGTAGTLGTVMDMLERGDSR